MLLDLTDRRVIVTGGARGIGLALVESFLAEGSRVAVLDLDVSSLDALVATHHGDLVAITCDVRSEDSVSSAVAAAAAELGGIDVLVNNAGINVQSLLEETSDAAWTRCFDVNVGGVFRVSKAVIPYLKGQRSGRIINAASFAAVIPSVGSAAYAASKSAVVQLTRVLASELGPWDITVNAYAPGMVPTAMNGFAELPTAQQDELLDTLSVRRWEEPEDVANVVRFLASDQAGYVTGALIDVSGGKFATQFPARARA
ncbi:SDR family NAD(P)-dependent oxidoreductase [Plantibacter sp. lyk4-40-MEA-4]|uniref:SDR family NAD(P)-dependent oxidoreductase n=1 Tax=Plantibacter sp. lyk4-40-MEA-4 TaxID=3040298 RepID=UPI00254F36E0|nr:SDR family NAD(P)-dependent oxidoreductase [Plantibacter sp. lyk4-40-MEA-4]